MLKQDSPEKPVKKAKKIALCAILSALSTLILFLGAVFDIFSIASVAVAALFICAVMIEIGSPYPFLVWGVTSALSLILLPNKLPAILYALFGGIYPILKEHFERLHYLVAWPLKLSVFNCSLLLIILLTKHIFYLNDSEIDFTIPVIILGNIAFLLTDIALSKLIRLYLVKIRRHMGITNYFEN